MRSSRLACAAICVCAAGILNAATIQGRVTAESGAIQGTVVLTFFRVAAMGAGGVMAPVTGKEAGAGSGAVPIKADGSYQISGLGAGFYQICIVTEGNEYIDPCAWQTAGTIELRSEKANAKWDLALETGARLQVELEDQPGLLARKEKPLARSSARVGIRLDNGGYVPVQMRRTSDGGLVHELVVPKQKSLHLQVETPGVELSDERGVRATAGGRTSLAVFVKGPESVKHVKLTASEDRR